MSLAALDAFTAGELEDQGLVEAGDGLEVQAVETFDDGKARRLDAPFDHAALAVDELQLGQAQQEARVVQGLGGTVAGKLLVLAQEGRQLELLEVMREQFPCPTMPPAAHLRVRAHYQAVIQKEDLSRYALPIAANRHISRSIQ
jgi:hypothetical protein